MGEFPTEDISPNPTLRTICDLDGELRYAKSLVKLETLKIRQENRSLIQEKKSSEPPPKQSQLSLIVANSHRITIYDRLTEQISEVENLMKSSIKLREEAERHMSLRKVKEFDLPLKKLIFNLNHKET